MPFGCNQQGLVVLDIQSLDMSNVRGIQPVSFRQVLTAAVVFSQAP